MMVSLLANVKNIIIGLGILFSFIGYAMTMHYKDKYEDIKSELSVCKQTIEDTVKNANKVEELYKEKLHLVREVSVIRRKTIHEVEQKEDKGEDYEILASDSCGCKFDGIGWVFK